ncbi:MAG TPA: hypothetical protein VFU02_23235 [Polyangiaceae bacterium]|nr:hypothetical protein [Polyangiaceae bacterium]
MSEFVFLFPVVALVAVGFFFLRGRAAVANYDLEYANYRAGALAQRLGLQLVQGDPNFNVFIRQANLDVQRGPKDNRPIHIEVRAQGAPQGVPLEFVYLYRVEQDTGFTQVTWRTWFDCRLTARARQPFPPFEVVSKNAPLGTIAQTLPLAPLPTGNPAVDASYAVTTREPALARLLGELLPAFATFQNSGVHLVGDGNSVSFVMHQDKSPLLANVLYHAEVLATQLSQVARRLGG